MKWRTPIHLLLAALAGSIGGFILRKRVDERVGWWIYLLFHRDVRG